MGQSCAELRILNSPRRDRGLIPDFCAFPALVRESPGITAAALVINVEHDLWYHPSLSLTPYAWHFLKKKKKVSVKSFPRGIANRYWNTIYLLKKPQTNQTSRTKQQHKNPSVRPFLDVGTESRAPIHSLLWKWLLYSWCVELLEGRSRFNGNFLFEGWTCSVCEVWFLVWIPDMYLNISMTKNHYCAPVKVGKYKGSKFFLQVIFKANSHRENYSASFSQDFLHFICPSSIMYSFLA